MKKLLVTLLVGVLAFTLTSPAAYPTVRHDRCPSTASVCHYHLPSRITDARHVCYSAEADTRDIPLEGSAYADWWRSASSSARADWTRAFKACQGRHQLPGGKWAWDQMVFVGSE
jgi:hypothetical protein